MPLGEDMIKKGFITQDQLDQALEEQKKSGDKIGEILVKLGFATEDQVNSCL